MTYLFTQHLIYVVFWCVSEMRLERTLLQFFLLLLSTVHLFPILFLLNLLQTFLIQVIIYRICSWSPCQSELLWLRVDWWSERRRVFIPLFLHEKIPFGRWINLLQQSKNSSFELCMIKNSFKLVHFLKNRSQKDKLVLWQILNRCMLRWYFPVLISIKRLKNLSYSLLNQVLIIEISGLTHRHRLVLLRQSGNSIHLLHFFMMQLIP